MTSLKVICLVDGESTTFPVTVQPTDLVGDLKDAVWKKIPEFKEIPAKNLPILIQSLKDNETLLDSLQEEQKEQEEQEKQKKKTKLHEMDVISDVFKEKPPTSTIHIIVQLPQPGNATFCSMQAFQRALSSSTIVPIIDAYSSPIASKRSFEDAGEYSCL